MEAGIVNERGHIQWWVDNKMGKVLDSQ
jgi:hypothetical protein